MCVVGVVSGCECVRRGVVFVSGVFRDYDES